MYKQGINENHYLVIAILSLGKWKDYKTHGTLYAAKTE